MNSFEDNSHQELPPEVLMRGLLRAYYWMDESLQNGLQRAGYRPRTRTQTMILIHISNGVTRAAELARALGVSRQAIQQQQTQIQQLQSQLNRYRPSEAPSTEPMTGRHSRFQSYTHFYPQLNARSASGPRR